MTKPFESPPAYTPISETAVGFVTPGWRGWFIAISALFTRGYTGTVPLAKLTGGGTDGSLTFTYGVLTSVVAPT